VETSHNVFGNSIDVIGILLDGIMSIEVPMILVNVTEKAEDLIIVSANYAYCRMLGYTPKELSGSAAKILAGPDTNLDEWEALGRSIKSNVAPPPGKCYLYKKMGHGY
jgi:PAS domain-containing protein